VVPHDWPCAEVSALAAVSVGLFAAASAAAGAICRFVLPGVPMSVSWVVVAVGHHYLRNQNDWECCVSVLPSGKLSFH
jgi:hypothetical protein